MISFFEGQHFSEATLVQKDEDVLVLDKTELLFQRLKQHPSFKSTDPDQFKEKHTQIKKGEVVSSRIQA
jgi:hypothetical protein